MPRFISTTETTGFLKRTGEMLKFPKGTTIAGNYAADNGNSMNFKFGGAMAALKIWDGDVAVLAYDKWDRVPDTTAAKVNSPTGIEVKLAVPYWNQVDNKNQPERTCNSSSCAMVAKFLGAKISSDDEYWKMLHEMGYDSTDHGGQSVLLTQLGIKSTWHTNLDFKDLDESLKRGRPIVIGILHRGSEDYPTGGHMLVIVGKTSGGDYIVCDPYGSINDGYTQDVSNGNGAVYKKSMLIKRWTADGVGTGWGRLFA